MPVIVYSYATKPGQHNIVPNGWNTIPEGDNYNPYRPKMEITMSIFSKLFRSSENRQTVDRIFEKSRENAAQKLRPLGALGSTIVLASQKCRDSLKPSIVTSDEKERQRRETFAFYEFVYFFLHMTMRLAVVAMTEPEKKHLGKHLLMMVASVSVDGSFENLPDDLRKRMIAEFCTNLQRAENQYAASAPGDIFSDSEAEKQRNWGALFLTLGENVALAMGCQNDGELKSKIANLAMEQFGHLNLLNPILDFKRDSMELPDDYLVGRMED